MPIITATEVTELVSISLSAGTITSRGYIPRLQLRLPQIINNYFIIDGLKRITTGDFTASTFTADVDLETDGFKDGDEVLILGSYRNDGYYETTSVTTYTLTLASGYTWTEEASGANILVAPVRWPTEIKEVVARMIKYDADERGKRGAGLTSRTIGPYSESYRTSTADNPGGMGYPQDIIDDLMPWHKVNML